MKAMIKYFITILLMLMISWCLPKGALAVVDPRLFPNNKVGITLLSPDAEIEDASKLVNTNGDWGWVLIIIKKSERNVDRWQNVFDQLAKKRLIPIVRLATGFDNKGYWQRPGDEDAVQWADFLGKLYWPVKNRYVQVYNEVNHAQEWGGTVDPTDYAKELAKTTNALKLKSADFFILNAPLDLALPNSSSSMDAGIFYNTMENSQPGIFKKLDGWASHSYPNPGFVASPYTDGRLGIRGYLWEQNLISTFIDGKTLPVFITETGWKRQNEHSGGLDEETIAGFYRVAFDNIWQDRNIVAVTPFVFNFPDATLGAFSFKAESETIKEKFFKYYYAVQNLAKTKGQPTRENKAADFEFKIPKTLITNLEDKGEIKLRNVGNYVWVLGKNTTFTIKATNAKVGNFKFSSKEVFPGQVAYAQFRIKGVKTGPAEIKFTAKSENVELAHKQMAVNSESLIAKIVEELHLFSK